MVSPILSLGRWAVRAGGGPGPRLPCFPSRVPAPGNQSPGEGGGQRGKDTPSWAGTVRRGGPQGPGRGHSVARPELTALRPGGRNVGVTRGGVASEAGQSRGRGSRVWPDRVGSRQPGPERRRSLIPGPGGARWFPKVTPAQHHQDGQG